MQYKTLRLELKRKVKSANEIALNYKVADYISRFWNFTFYYVQNQLIIACCTWGEIWIRVGIYFIVVIN